MKRLRGIARGSGWLRENLPTTLREITLIMKDSDHSMERKDPRKSRYKPSSLSWERACWCLKKAKKNFSCKHDIIQVANPKEKKFEIAIKDHRWKENIKTSKGRLLSHTKKLAKLKKIEISAKFYASKGAYPPLSGPKEPNKAFRLRHLQNYRYFFAYTLFKMILSMSNQQSKYYRFLFEKIRKRYKESILDIFILAKNRRTFKRKPLLWHKFWGSHRYLCTYHGLPWWCMSWEWS